MSSELAEQSSQREVRAVPAEIELFIMQNSTRIFHSC